MDQSHDSDLADPGDVHSPHVIINLAVVAKRNVCITHDLGVIEAGDADRGGLLLLGDAQRIHRDLRHAGKGNADGHVPLRQLRGHQLGNGHVIIALAGKSNLQQGDLCELRRRAGASLGKKDNLIRLAHLPNRTVEQILVYQSH